MSDSYKGARTVTTDGLTLSAGNVFSGFISATSQNVTISGTRTYDLSGANVPVVIGTGIGIVVPIKANHIKPAGGNVIIFFD